MEIYKTICNFENYAISNKGAVKNLTTGKVLKPQLSSSGYFNVTLSVNGRKYTPTIHSLVAEAFITKKNQTVNHKDGDKLNNSLENLEYVTYGGNLSHAHKTGLRSRICKKNKKNTSGKIGVVWDAGYWVARMHKNSKAIYLGRSKNKDVAIALRVKAENDYK